MPRVCGAVRGDGGRVIAAIFVKIQQWLESGLVSVCTSWKGRDDISLDENSRCRKSLDTD